LGVHAAIVGGGWFVVAFVGLVLVLPDPPAWLSEAPEPLQGAGWTVVAVASFPLAWPAYIAIGWYEAGLADRVRRGERPSAARARQVLRVQAVLFAVAALLAAVVAVAERQANGHEYVTLAWMPLAAIALAHLWTARRVSSA
jgi:hypothetical protein